MSETFQQGAGLKKIYDAWYKSGTPHWEDAPGKNVLVAALKVCCPTEQNLKLLDIGCGTGTFLARIHEEVSKSWTLHGVDFSRIAIKRARRHRPFHFAWQDATSLEDASESFDIVTCYGSWEHFQDPQSAICEAGRILAPGGWLFSMIPTLGIHRTDRDNEGWYEDIEIIGCAQRQMQWNLKRSTWVCMFEQAGIKLTEDSLAKKCGALKPGVFFFGFKEGSTI
jgi:SAM-dependent methyltransferase